MIAADSVAGSRSKTDRVHAIGCENQLASVVLVLASVVVLASDALVLASIVLVSVVPVSVAPVLVPFVLVLASDDDVASGAQAPTIIIQIQRMVWPPLGP